MNELLLNRRTRAALELYLRSPAHAILLSGRPGVGLQTIAKNLAREVGGVNQFLVLPDEKNKISVDETRKLYELTQGKRNEPFVVVVDDADTMTSAAQNAFLKLLEEPAKNVHFILTAHDSGKLLPTIYSRVQEIEVLPVENSMCEKLFDGVKIMPSKRSQMLFLAAGLPAELTRMINDDEYFRGYARMGEQAKAFISGDAYARLQIVSGVKTRPEAIKLTEGIANLLTFMMERNAAKNLIDSLVVVGETIDNLTTNGNVRAQMTYLATNMV